MTKQNSLSPAATAIALVAVLGLIVIAYWYFGRNSGSYYGGVRTVPKLPPTMAAQRPAPAPAPSNSVLQHYPLPPE